MIRTLQTLSLASITPPTRHSSAGSRCKSNSPSGGGGGGTPVSPRSVSVGSVSARKPKDNVDADKVKGKLVLPRLASCLGSVLGSSSLLRVPPSSAAMPFFCLCCARFRGRARSCVAKTHCCAPRSDTPTDMLYVAPLEIDCLQCAPQLPKGKTTGPTGSCGQDGRMFVVPPLEKVR